MEESGIANFTLQEVTHLRLDVDEVLAPAPLDNKDAHPAHHVDLERYYTFWKRLEHPDFATFFAESLLRRLKEVQLAQASSSHGSTALPSTDDESTPRAVSNGTPKHFRQSNKTVGNSRSADTDDDRLKTAMVGTLYILALYLPVDEEDASLQSALKAAQRALRKQRVTPERESDIDFQSFVLQLFDPNSCASQLGEFKPTKFVLWVRQMQVVVLHCVNRVCETSKLSPSRGGGGLEGTASFMWLLESLQSTNGAPFKAVLDCISDFMVWPASVQRDQALCCCLIMIRRFMVNYIVEVGMLDESICIITPLYRFRNPVGVCAKATLTMLAREQRAPGSSFQERLAMEVDEFSLRGVDKAATQQSGTGAGNYPRGTRVYVLVNMNAKQGGSFREKLDWTPRQQDQTELQQSIKPTQLQLLVSMMAHAGLTDRSTELAKIDAQSVDTPSLRTLYRRALVAAMRAQQVCSTIAPSVQRPRLMPCGEGGALA
ncbi:hypothetical protein CYMTET_16332 [Cymbomonas tetramitiformis]|uniref:Uncharacterized protein n=1 Tax=Cymbomonas tetramitiformis TaxID=36881 RepID=A0AAE0GCS5_9CHLO|nr:hypothetical protein CYMTET_16332 [Cymbomonas tetramitiformis]